ncbi:MAG: hydrogenase 4 subunit F [Magnetococcales bacterium]|nr:hydrogenase 4 subunit F [Magnetococcales bacterium]
MIPIAVPAVIALPALAAVVLAIIPSYRLGAWVNLLVSTAVFVISASLFHTPLAVSDYFLLDEFNIYLIVLNTFVGMTTSIFSATYISHELENGKLSFGHLRFYHAMYQILMASMNLALLSNNLGLMWVGIELATLTTVVMVGIYRTPAAIEASWKYFILGSVGISLAFFGIILIYLAAQPIIGEGSASLTFTKLMVSSAKMDPKLLSLAFVFLLVGYGTKVGLAPLHAWLPDAHAEGPTPISAVLSGLLLNVALYALLRFKMLLAGNASVLSPGPILVTMGLVSLVFAGIMLYQRKDIKRLFAYSSIEHMGIITFAFGLGGPLANFAGLLHMTMHSLTKSAIFFAVGHISQAKGTQNLADIRGLGTTHPVLSWGLVLGVAAIAGLPPFGVFTSEFLIITTTFAQHPLLAILLVIGLLIAFCALLMRLQEIVFGPPSETSRPVHASLAPLFIHLMLVLLAGIHLPGELAQWFTRVAEMLG